MPIQHVNRNETDYQKLIDAALRRVPAHSPEWTDYNHSDPGMTLIQLFSWLGESLLDRLDRIPESSRARFRRVAARLRRRRRPARLRISGGNKKTRAAVARFIAKRLGLSLCRIDLSTVFSKYIGETEKNLRRLFDSAEASGAILLFDEADSLFGKRSEVKDSHDRYANQDVARLLRRIEGHQGLVILATNRKEKLDACRWCKLHCDVSKLVGINKRSTKAGGKASK